LTVRRRKIRLATSADLSIHPLEVCPGALKALSFRIGDLFWPASADHQCAFSALCDLRYRLFSVALQHKNSIENT
jgi:hypothetical protein